MLPGNGPPMRLGSKAIFLARPIDAESRRNVGQARHFVGTGSLVAQKFGSFDQFKQQFNDAAKGLFGSGWTWLVKDASGNVSIEPMSNAGTPIQKGITPLLTCDVWEHAYYIDYRNARPKYLDGFWSLVNWEFVARQYHAATPA